MKFSLKGLVLFLFMFILSACSSDNAPINTVKDYLSSDISGRLNYVLYPDKIKPEMDKNYANTKDLIWDKEKLNHVTFDYVKNDKLAVDFVPKDYDVVVMKDKDNGKQITEYVVKKDANGNWKINWEASIPYNEMNFIEFKNKKPNSSTVFRVNAKIDNYYNYEFSGASDTYYSINLSTQNGTQSDYIVGYIRKTDPGADTLFNFLKDGQLHPVTVSLLPVRSNGNVALIDKFISKGWIN